MELETIIPNAVPTLVILALFALVIILLKEKKEKRYITYLDTQDLDKAWECYYQRIKLNPGSDKYEIRLENKRYIVRKEI